MMIKHTNVSSTEHCLTMKAVHPGPNGIHRDALFDNARFLLIGLIILSHCMERIWLRNIYIYSLYQYLFMLHIPCLAMISGYFSTQELSFHLLYRMARQLLVPFIVFEAAYRIFIWQIPIPDLITFMPPYVDERTPFVSPFWLMWYLLSLFSWRLLLPLFARLPYPLVIGIAVGLSAGLIPLDKYFCVQRTLVFFPFFLAGYEMRRQGRQLWIKSIPKIYYYIVLLIGLPAVMVQHYPLFFILGRVGYLALYPSVLTGMIARLFFYATSIILSVSFLSIVTTRQTILTAFGQRTLSAYVLHGFIILLLRYFNFFSIFQQSHLQILIFVMPAVLTPLLCSRTAHLFVHYLCNFDQLLKKTDA